MCVCAHIQLTNRRTKIIPLKRRRKELHLHGVLYIYKFSLSLCVGYSGLLLCHTHTAVRLFEPCIFVSTRLTNAAAAPLPLIHRVFIFFGSVTCLNWRFNHIPFFFFHSMCTWRAQAIDRVSEMISEIYSYHK